MNANVNARIEYGLQARTVNPTEAWKIWEGRTIDGKFPLLRWLGASDHSAVFLTNLGDSQKAVVKLIPANNNADRQLANWAAAAKLSHPNLLRLFDMGRCRFDGTPLLYLVMEYADEDLSQIIPQRPLAPAEVGDMLPPLLDALSYLHSRGLVHTRVKPANILAVGEQLKLSSDRVWPRGEFVEKTDSLSVYDAPEVAAGEIFPAIDVWSLGVTLVEALTQNPPAGAGPKESAQKDPIVPESIPEPFRSIARQALHRDVKQRCTIADIKAWRPPQQEPALTIVPPAPEPAKPSRSKWIIAGIVAVALVALAVIVKNRGVAPREEPPVVQSTPKVEQPAPPPAPFDGAVAHQVLPEIPHSARNTIKGVIKIGVRVDVDASGKVTNAKLTKSGPSEYFARLVLAASQQWDFAPPQANGAATASTWLLRYELTRSSTKAFASRERTRS